MSYFLWFLFFVSVPVLVHLFSFRRAKRALFTNVRFIKLVSTETKSKARLKQLLVLSCRILAFTFLILAFIASFVRFDGDDLLVSDSLGGIYLDNSVGAVGDGIVDQTMTVSDILEKDDFRFATFLTNDFSPFSNRARAVGEIKEELSSLSISYAKRELSEILARNVQGSDNYLISDFAQASLDEMYSIKEDSLRRYHLFVTKDGFSRNAYIDSVWVEKDLEDYQSNILKCVLGHSTNMKDADVVVRLLDSNGNQVSSVVKKLRDNPLITFTLPVLDKEAFYRIQLTGDDAAYDNDFYFVVNGSFRPRILLLSESRNSYLNSVFGNDELFDFVITSPSEIDYELLKSVDLLVINDFVQFPEGLVEQGIRESSILIFPSDSIDIENYSSKWALSFNRNDRAESQQLELVQGNLLLDGAYKIDDEIVLPRAVKRYDVQGPHERLLVLRDGSTFFGKSLDRSLYFFLSPLQDDYTELPKHSLFLPIMYRIAEMSAKGDIGLFSYPGDFLEIAGFSAETPPKITSENVELIPEFSLKNQKGLLKIPNDLPPGFYHVLQGEDTIRSFGINIPKDESINEGPSFNEIENFFSESSHVNVISSVASKEGSGLSSEDGNHLWKYALILAVMFMLVETLFHRYLK